jgi:nucleoside phosphorylase
VTGPAISNEELLVHVFVGLDEITGTRPYEQLITLWQRCRPSMGHKIAGTSLPIELPASAAELPGGTVSEAVIAGQQSADGGCQAVLRRRHDILNLSVLYTTTKHGTPGPSPKDPPQARHGWAQFDHLWQHLIADAHDILLGEVRIYYGHLPPIHSLPLAASPDLALAARRTLPHSAEGERWWATGVTTTTGFPIWEISPRDDTRTLRRILLLTPEQHDAPLSAWAWSSGDPSSPPLARYLLHAAKIRYEIRVWDQGRKLGALRARAADTIDHLRSGPANDNNAPDHHGLRDVEIDVASAVAELTAMKRTVEIAADNMARNVMDVVPDHDGLDLFADDRTLADIFVTQLEDELTYMRVDQTLLHQTRGITTTQPSQHTGDEPTIGILTAMPLEFHAVRSLLDNVHEATVPLDHASYVRAELPSHDPHHRHHIVLTQTGATGTSAAADAATNLTRSFPTVRCLIMTGIAAGVPNPHEPQRHVRLGDIVLATWGIVDYEHVVIRDGFDVELRETFPRPWHYLCRLADRLEADEEAGHRPWEQWLDTSHNPALTGYSRPPDDADQLTSHPTGANCRHPRRSASGHRPGWPKVHQGRIGSANISLRDGRVRDQLANQHNLRAFEMEGAGVGASAFLNDRHWFMIRGISDYADNTYDTRWRKYAALAAAAYLRTLLEASQPMTSSRH